MNFLQRENATFIVEIKKFHDKSDPYISALFDPVALKNTNPHVWWKAMAIDI